VVRQYSRVAFAGHGYAARAGSDQGGAALRQYSRWIEPLHLLRHPVTDRHKSGQLQSPTQGYCAWHDYTGDGYGVTPTDIAFSNQPYNIDVGSSCGTNFVNSGSAGTLDGYTMTLGHEWHEMMSDQFPAGGWTNHTGSSYNGQENSDECAWIAAGQQGGAANVVMGNGTTPNRQAGRTTRRAARSPSDRHARRRRRKRCADRELQLRDQRPDRHVHRRLERQRRHDRITLLDVRRRRHLDRDEPEPHVCSAGTYSVKET
jgi:hypothetical protein